MKIIPNRNIKCKCCNKTKHAKNYVWVMKGEAITLNSRTCRTCANEDIRITNQHKKIHPKPKNSKCECCGKVANLHCDHSHSKSKKFRGWLCSKCNVGIGNLGDNVVGLKRALRYLTKLSK